MLRTTAHGRPTAASAASRRRGPIGIAVKAFLRATEDDVIPKVSRLDKPVRNHHDQGVVNEVFRMVKPLVMKPLGQFGRGQVFRLRNVQQAVTHGGKPSPGVGGSVGGSKQSVVVGAGAHGESF
jgi:hypothetical protein